jgi:hypothetical protein
VRPPLETWHGIWTVNIMGATILVLTFRRRTYLRSYFLHGAESLIRYDTVRYDMIWYDTWYDIYHMIPYDMIYLIAVGLTPGGSSTVRIYTQTIHRTAQSTQTIHRTTQFTN